MEKLRRNIEVVRGKLNAAVSKGYDEQTCYGLSLELDRLIEIYISMKEKERVPTA